MTKSGSESRQRQRTLSVRMTEAEYDRALELARAAGPISLSAFGRAAVLRRRLPRSRTDAKAVADLGRLGGLLKLAITEAGAGRLPDLVEYRSLLRQIEHQVATLVRQEERDAGDGH
jgi:hypothetical protein